MSDLKKHSLLILMAVLILIVIPMSFAADVDDTNATDVVGTNDADSVDVDAVSADENDNLQASEDDILGTDLTITLDSDEIEMEEGGSGTLSGKLTYNLGYSVYKDNAAKMVCTYTDGNGQKQSQNVMTSQGLFSFDLSTFTGLTASGSPYTLNITGEDPYGNLEWAGYSIPGSAIATLTVTGGTTPASYDFVSTPNETDVTYTAGEDKIINITITGTHPYQYDEYMWAYIDNNDPVVLVSISEINVLPSAPNAVSINLKRYCDSLSVGEHTIIFRPTDNYLSTNGITNPNYVPLTVNIVSAPQPATVYYVNSTAGADGNGSEGSTYTTIAAAITAANQYFGDDGGQIVIKAGNYDETAVSEIQKSLEITADGDVTVTSTGLNSVFSQATATSVKITGITFKDIQATRAIYLQSTAADKSLVIENCNFINNNAQTLVRLSKSKNSYISGCNFIGNNLTGIGNSGGLVNIDEGGYAYTLTVSTCNIVDNSVVNNKFASGVNGQPLVANNNYWGTNEPADIFTTGYNHELTLDNYVVLNIIANPETMETGETSSLSYNFELNTGASAGSIPALDVTLSAVNGTVSGNTYTAPDAAGTDNILAKYGNFVLATKNLTINAPEPLYKSTPSPSVVEYTKGVSTVISVSVTGSTVADFDGSSMYMYVNGSSKGIEIVGVDSDATSFTVDLADYDSYFVAGEVYSIVFRPPTGLFDYGTPSLDECEFDTLNVTVKAAPTPINYLYVSTPEPNATDYILGESKNITVTVVSEYLSEFSKESVFAWINGEDANSKFLINGITGNQASFTFDLAQISDKLVEGVNSITFHVNSGAIESVIQSTDYKFNVLTVTVPAPAQDIKYESNATVDGNSSVDYTINEHEDVVITVTCDLLNQFEYEKLYAWIGDVYKEINVMANEASATVDLKGLSDKFGFEEGHTYTIYFHPDIDDLSYIGVKDGEYKFNPLTVTVVGSYVPEPTLVYNSTPKVNGKDSIEYVIGDNVTVAVSVVYTNVQYPSGFDGKSMRVFINGADGVVISGVSANATSFTVNLADYISAPGEYNISFHPDESTLSWVFYGVDNAVYEFNNLTVTAVSAPVPPAIKYESNATVDGNSSVDYIINEHEDVVITVTCDLLDQFEYEKLYAWIGDVYKEINVMANEASATVDLKDLCDKFGFVEGHTYTIYFHPDIDDLSYIGVKDGEYKFNPLTVTVVGSYVPEPTLVYNSTPKADGKDSIEYAIGDNVTVTVTIAYNESYGNHVGFDGKSMRVFINGADGVVISGVSANATSFTVNLADYISAPGEYNISFHPDESTLSWVFYDVDNRVYEFNNLTVTAVKVVDPTKPTYNVTADSPIEYIKDSEQNIAVTIKFDDVYANADFPVYVFFGSATEGILVDGVKANDSSFVFDLKTISDKFSIGTNTISFHPYAANLTSIADGEFDFAPITVNVKENVDPSQASYISTPEPNATEYTPGESKNITVTVVYDAYFSDDLSNVTMFVYINGEEIANRVAIDDVKANATSFVFDLKTVSDKLVEGTNNLTFHPHDGALPFAGPYVFNKLAVTIKSSEPEKTVIPADEAFNVTNPADSKTPTYSINMPANATGNFTVSVDGSVYETKALVNGSALITVSGLAAGDHNITVSYNGDDTYAAISKNTNVTIPKSEVPADEAFNVTNPAGSKTPTYSINLPGATGNFTVSVDGSVYETKALVNGSASITVSGLAAGSHNVVVSYSGDDNYSPISKNTTVTIQEPVINLSGNKDIKMLYTSGTKYEVYVTEDGKAVIGKTVTFTVNGKEVTVKTDKNGYASVKINLAPRAKKYTVTASYGGKTVKNTVKVNSIIKAKNIKIKKSKKVVKIKVTLKKVNKKYLKGKKLTLKIKGKKIKAKTNKKGVATFKIKKNVLKKLKVGKKYKYTVTYKKDKVTKKATVKK